jgi:cation:H+ antiporter
MRGWRERLRVRKPGAFAFAVGLDAAMPPGSPLSALWTFPSMIASAFLVAWGAEAAEFLMSQGLALAVLALVQTLPEFAVEAVIAWKAGKDPGMVHLAIANFTGSLRLLTGLGWPMIYAVAAFYSRKKNGAKLGRITLADDQAVEVLGLLPPLAYFVVVWAKASLSLFDAAILAATYVVYLAVLLKMPAREECIEEDEEIPAVSKWALSYSGGKRWAAVGSLLLGGGAVIYFVAEPFLTSMMALAVSFGMSQFVFIQWVAPFLSEFPEKTSAFAWARRVTRAPVALVNMVSSNINQWGILSGLLGVIYCWSHGSTEPLPFDAFQRSEILLTIVQAFLGWLFLASMSFEAYEAGGLFGLWLVQFLVPSLRHQILFVYGAWIVIEVGLVATGRKKLLAFEAFARSWKGKARA